MVTLFEWPPTRLEGSTILHNQSLLWRAEGLREATANARYLVSNVTSKYLTSKKKKTKQNKNKNKTNKQTKKTIVGFSANTLVRCGFSNFFILPCLMPRK